MLLVSALPARGAASAATVDLYFEDRLVTTFPATGSTNLVPLRQVADALGLEINWDAEAQAATVKSPYRTARVQVGDKLIVGELVIIGTREAPRLESGRLWVPLAGLLQALSYVVREEPGRVTISLDRTVQLVPPAVSPVKQITMQAALDADNWTVISGTADPALGLTGISFRGKILVTVPVGPDGRFSARLNLSAGKYHILTVVGLAPGTRRELGYVGVRTPPFLEPFITPGTGMTVQTYADRPDQVKVTHEIRGEELVLDIQLQVPAWSVQVWLYGLYEYADFRRLTLVKGHAQTVFRLPGPAAYTVAVLVPDQNGLNFAPAMTMQVLQHEEVARDNGGINVNLIPKLDKVPTGRFVDYVPVSGTTSTPGDGFILAHITYRERPGAAEVGGFQKLPVTGGRFDAKVWLKYGPGEYEVHLAHPKNRIELAWDERFQVENVGTAVLRYLTPTQIAESDDPEVLKLARELTAGKTDAMEKVKAVYSWVTRNITYNHEKLATGELRIADGAVHTLAVRTGNCYDYANLTVALLRAAGVEARVASGTAGTKPPLIGHDWVEARVGGRWVTMDPTWDAAQVYGGVVLVPARTTYFDPDPEFFAREHQFERYRD
ncbi:MAG TPA: transglutaminase domain-containing protein [Symbiobacteriaceae bacterium]|nr:transglutaminase domain-containing protein [Symbiobacteriaceae bacterium]